ncbi:MAG: hypothetical protein IMF05_06090 [Proteobacteria bacterium]|nr:hypothetical protein [Pseudomonadota bacterium]
MVVGIDKFREHFTGYQDQYAIIGGAACDLLFDQAGLRFRATKDIDMVLCVEVVDAAFGERFNAFLDAGGYEARERSNGKKEYYRFHRPKDDAYPFMIELFSRKPNAMKLPEGAELTPVSVEEDAVSLSAILLEEGYYEALQNAKREVDGVTIIDETLLIPFKARAFLDLSARKEKGEKIDSKNIKKHRNDVFRLAQLLSRDADIEISDPIRDDLRRFLDQAEADETLDPKAFDVPLTREEAVALLRSAYRLT